MMHTLFFHIKVARLRMIGSLVFLLLAACSGVKDEEAAVTIHWNGNSASGLIIPRSLLQDFTEDSIGQWLHVRRANMNTPILGEFTVQDKAVLFEPLISLTRGLNYDVSWKNDVIQRIEVPAGETRKDPGVFFIFPSKDSLPENLLKIYIEFTRPMQEGRALDHITVVKNGRDTVPGVFLDLTQELWNKERTILTLWLDPGRIKRDLQPNLKMGAPLQAGNRYEIVVQPGWADIEGSVIPWDYRKVFFVTSRDDRSPNPEAWTIHAPKAGTSDPVKIGLQESLDYQLLRNAVGVIDSKGKKLDGVIRVDMEETVWYFIPGTKWTAGQYSIEVEPRLEDLAGNNLERLFDRDLLKDSTNRKTGVYKRTFYIR